MYTPPATATALDIYLLMYPWLWERLFESLLAAGEEYQKVQLAPTYALARQLKGMKNGEIP
ncbi:hypothetical protein [Pantoea eucrina]|uniref:hypothetical protein n=1 Tax=Pantoea eucrina TaxID=472693 RepID=UPI00080F4947|nr:hypothetical protein [Pantoea eucrina]